MNRKRLPFVPESLESLRGRYSSAVAKLVDVESVSLGSAYDPGASREHVFDTEEGIRLIISREDQGKDGNVLHLSVSFDDRFPLEFIKRGGGFITALIERRFREISGDKREFYTVVPTPDGILHWYILESPAKNFDLGKIEFTL